MSLLLTSAIENGVQVVSLNSPETKNALGLEMRQAISENFLEATLNDDIRCVVLSGGEHYFSAGADVKSVVEYGPTEMAEAQFEQYWQAVKHFPKPLIAAVNGYAIGGGCELAMHADIIIAGESAKFAQPEVAVGIIPGSGATQRLPRAVGKYRAMRVLLTGQPFSAQEALDMGLVSDIVADAEVRAEAITMATLIAGYSQSAVRRLKEVVLAGADLSLESGLLLERQALHLLFDTPGQKEGMRALLERRKPDFSGS